MNEYVHLVTVAAILFIAPPLGITFIRACSPEEANKEEGYVDPLQEVMAERARQDKKWGEQDHPDAYWLGILMEEVGEMAHDMIEGGSVKKELVQVCAVALAWLECLERNKEVRDE